MTHDMIKPNKSILNQPENPAAFRCIFFSSLKLLEKMPWLFLPIRKLQNLKKSWTTSWHKMQLWCKTCSGQISSQSNRRLGLPPNGGEKDQRISTPQNGTWIQVQEFPQNGATKPSFLVFGNVLVVTFAPWRNVGIMGMNGKNQKVVSHYLDVPGS